MMPDVRAHYTNAGYSRRAYARKLDLHEHQIKRLESGRRVHPAAAKKVADDMQVTVVELMPLEEAA